jgi:hypothetical protein
MSALPPLVRNWLIGRYLEDPTPGLCSLSDEGQPEPVVFVRYSDFTDFLVQAGIELLPNLDVWRKAGWIADVMAVITLSAKEDSKPLPYVLARLNLSPGRHRLIGIRRGVFDAPVETGEGEKPKPADRRKGIPREEAEILVREWLMKNAKHDPASITRDAVHAGTGVSTGQISQTAAWKAFIERRNAEAKPRAREIPLTDTMQAVVPDDCAMPDELAALIEEQRLDEAEETRRHKPS